MKASVKTIQPNTVVFKLVEGSYSKIPGVFREIYKWIGDKGYISCDSPIVVYITEPGELPDCKSLWEVRVPLAVSVEVSEADTCGIGVKRTGVSQVASVIHDNSYETVNHSYFELTDWIRDNGYEVVGPHEELYFHCSKDANGGHFNTEIRYPVKRLSPNRPESLSFSAEIN